MQEKSLTAGIIGLGVSEKNALVYRNHDQVYLKSVYDFNQKELDKFHSSYPEKGNYQKVIHSFVGYILDTTITPLILKQVVSGVMSVCYSAV